MNLKKISSDALRLPPEGRAKLAQKLLLSLETQSADEIDAAWLAEAAERARAIDRGEVEPVSSAVVRRRARALLR